MHRVASIMFGLILPVVLILQILIIDAGSTRKLDFHLVNLIQVIILVTDILLIQIAWDYSNNGILIYFLIKITFKTKIQERQENSFSTGLTTLTIILTRQTYSTTHQKIAIAFQFIR